MGHSPAIITRRVKKVTEKYKIVYRGGTGELIQKKSRFIADIRPVKTEEEALSFIEETRKKYWDARHHCYAYIIGDRGQTARFSDDGEPSQTAGKPMMVVLTFLGSSLTTRMKRQARLNAEKAYRTAILLETSQKLQKAEGSQVNSWYNPRHKNY